MIARGTAFLFLGLAMLGASSASWANDKNVKGSIPLPAASKTPLHSLAKLSLSDAVAIGARESNGKVVEAFLSSESGFLVYVVVAAGSSDSNTELLVDAGNGQVLSRENMKISPQHDCQEEDRGAKTET